MTRLGAILHFQHKFPNEKTCIIVAEHRGTYHAVVEGSAQHQKFLEYPNNSYKVVSVKKYLREQLINAGYRRE